MSNTSTTKTAGNNAGAAEEIAVDETINGDTPERCIIRMRRNAKAFGVRVRKNRANGQYMVFDANGDLMISGMLKTIDILLGKWPVEKPFSLRMKTAVNETVNGKTAKCKIKSADKERREKQLRCMAAKKGLVVRKSRRKHATDADEGLYRLSDRSGQVIAGATYNLSLDELSKIISDRSAAADGNAEENAAEATQTEKEAIPHTINRGNTGTAVRSGKGKGYILSCLFRAHQQ